MIRLNLLTIQNFDLLSPLRQRLEAIEIHNPQIARLICTVIPAQCPFARDIKIGNQVLFTIPPLCKLNPFYEQLMMLRWRSLTFLADECGENVTQYC